MSLDQAYKKFDDARRETTEWFTHEIASLRTGRIKAAIVEGVTVEQYGVRTPLQGVASIALTDARTITISPWDASALPAIEKALVEAQVGAQPVVDGKIIRLSFPMLSSEMRAETIKQLHKKAEEARVRLRQARDESLSVLKEDKQKSAITEDDWYEGKKELDSRIDQANAAIAELAAKKETEIETL